MYEKHHGQSVVSMAIFLYGTYLFQIPDILFNANRDRKLECRHGNIFIIVTLCFIWCTLLVPSLNNTHPIFSEIFSILWVTTVICTVCDVINFWTKTWISWKLEKIFENRKHHSSSFVTVFGKNGLNEICVRIHFNAFWMHYNAFQRLPMIRNALTTFPIAR